MTDRLAGTESNLQTPSGCPVHAAPGGCPVSAQAQAFDPFAAEYLANPAAALQWSRDQEPVFFSPQLGYWVVSRYEDVKAVFRDNVTFSPSIALERVVPPSDEAMETLKRYNYQMNRTLVNEDEPAHMERRRALMEHFLPENLAAKEDMIRELTREKVDAFVDAGRVDLVEAMLWEIPLTVALHFLGVPKEDMDALKEFSVAHTVNTWGKPSPEQHVEGCRCGRPVLAICRDRAREDAQGAGRRRLDASCHPDECRDSGRGHRFLSAFDDDGDHRRWP